MKIKKIYRLYIDLYILIYLGYLLYIYWLRPTYNLVSTTAILFPFIILLVFQWFLRKQTKAATNKKEKRRFIIHFILVSILPVYCGFMLTLNEYKSHFSTERWLNNPDERVYMIDDLLTCYKLAGKSREEIVHLLGEPTVKEEVNSIIYYLGTERGLIKLDFEWLVISLNDHDKVIKNRIKTD
ncbi:hypothetical protein [Bacillus sp. SD088]|uniref:hypothetical protein n=1 Tax=Bacillus sp. SD088 TaxID=2782012 RepID=UPI001A960D38|nr:hypothetical protein [Bacillus sp. SD088]MBO0991847.1 hypothetical protein [Bacillus sp. SD088]